MPKYRMVRDRLERTGVFTFQCAEPATAEVVALAHDAAYVQQIVDGSLPPAAIRRIGFPWSPALVLRSLASVGGTLSASNDALERGWGGNLAGGTHHAFRAEGSGYCVFNDMAVAIQSLRKEGRLRRAAIVDLDVHQGDGTALIFEGDEDVFTLSIHGEKNFPFRKQRSRIDLALPDGTGDEEYLRTLDEVLPRVLEFRPEIIFYQSGVDALDTDTLGRLNLSLAGLSARDGIVMRAVHAAGIPFVITLGGGYSNPLERTAEAHANTFLNAFSVFSKPSR
ncbi:histone deacetylase family protein [Paludibaculum fermentans]|uniref:Histone deacetylase n=1 Tax=Paludibaculum fermentans TaxID=1473598 RepID=A0A7S7NR76_PALFE|nr:histone deacetylase [Paludibaculum fermentans]QOY87824.1 histone deacetylase [Paludibaculum fermentans]